MLERGLVEDHEWRQRNIKHRLWEYQGELSFPCNASSMP
jgi:hypothetical protein